MLGEIPTVCQGSGSGAGFLISSLPASLINEDHMLRGRLQHKYHYCGRCSRRVPLAEMIWQDGVLVCKTNDCQDSMLPEQKDAAITRAINNSATSTTEMQLDQKLTTGAIIDPDEVSFIP